MRVCGRDQTGAATSAVGRPRAFDRNLAIDAAKAGFWARGDQAASIAGLTEAMGITSSSLYAAFGSKQALFLEVLDRYDHLYRRFITDALQAVTARDVIQALLTGYVDLQTDPSLPPGGLELSTASVPVPDVAVGAALIALRRRTEQRLAERLNRAAKEPDWPDAADPADLARLVMTIAHGTGIQAISGATRGELYRVVETASPLWRTVREEPGPE